MADEVRYIVYTMLIETLFEFNFKNFTQASYKV